MRLMEQTIKLRREYITLTQALKEAGCIGTGGQAKWFLQEHPIKVNGQLEQRRGKKLHAGDRVTVTAELSLNISS